MKGLLLLVASKILCFIIFPAAFIYRMRRSGRGDYFREIAIARDRLGNVVAADLFNSVLIKKGGYQFGFGQETISSVIGKNQLSDTLTQTGVGLDNDLSMFEKDHSIKSIENFTTNNLK